MADTTQNQVEDQQEFVAWLKAGGMYNEFMHHTTMRHMMEVWERAKAEAAAIRKVELQAVVDLLDDVFYDPTFEPRDGDGQPITGDDMYLLDHPLQEQHLPALRKWFVDTSNEINS